MAPWPKRGALYGILGRVLKFLLLSILLATFILPAVASRIREPRRALVSALTSMLFAEVCYAFFLYVLYPRFN